MFQIKQGSKSQDPTYFTSDATSSSPTILSSISFNQFCVSHLDILLALLDIIVDSVKNSALFDDHDRKIFEQCGKFIKLVH